MEYFAGLDVGMEETTMCVIDREGKVSRPTIFGGAAIEVIDERSWLARVQRAAVTEADMLMHFGPGARRR